MDLIPTLHVFTSATCGHCIRFRAGVLGRMIEEQQWRIRIHDNLTDPQTTLRFGVESFPTLIIEYPTTGSKKDIYMKFTDVRTYENLTLVLGLKQSETEQLSYFEKCLGHCNMLEVVVPLS
jgi:hypothetical protein